MGIPRGVLRVGAREEAASPWAGRAPVAAGLPAAVVVAVVRRHAVAAVAVLALIARLHAQGCGAGTAARRPTAAVVRVRKK